MGLVVGSWFMRQPESIRPAVVAERLRAATGLHVEVRPTDDTLRIPALREELFDWTLADGVVTVHGFMPAHPYLWENLDTVMGEVGGQRSTAGHVWRPNPAHARLRAHWSALSTKDRFILSTRSIFGVRPLDRLLA